MADSAPLPQISSFLGFEIGRRKSSVDLSLFGSALIDFLSTHKLQTAFASSSSSFVLNEGPSEFPGAVKCYGKDIVYIIYHSAGLALCFHNSADGSQCTLY